MSIADVGAEVEVPYELGMEVYLLGSILLGSLNTRPILRACTRIVHPEMFGNPLNRRCYQAMVDLLSQGVEAPDFALVLRHMGNQSGDASSLVDYMVKLTECVATPLNWRHYAGLVRAAWQRRELLVKCSALQRKAADHEVTVPDLMREYDRIGRRLGLGGNATVEGSDVEMEDQGGRGGHTGLGSGFRMIDQGISTRGYPSAQTSIIVAGQKVGKTSLLISFLNANPTAHIGFVTLEMTPRQIILSAMKQMTGLSGRPLDIFDAPEWDEQVEQVKQHVTFFDGNRSEKETTIEEVIAWSLDEHDLRPFDGLVVDYVQLLATDERVGFDGTREMSVVSRKLVKLSKLIGVPVVAGSQATEKDGVLVTKQARKFEEDAGLVVNLTRKLNETQGKMKIKLNRFGPSGVEQDVTWSVKNLRYEEAEPTP